MPTVIASQTLVNRSHIAHPDGFQDNVEKWQMIKRKITLKVRGKLKSPKKKQYSEKGCYSKQLETNAITASICIITCSAVSNQDICQFR